MNVLVLVSDAEPVAPIAKDLNERSAHGDAFVFLPDPVMAGSEELAERLAERYGARWVAPPILRFSVETLLADEWTRCRGYSGDPISDGLLQRALPRWSKFRCGDWLMSLAIAAVPIDPEVDAFLDRESPELLIVAPLVNAGTLHPAYVRAALARGIPVVAGHNDAIRRSRLPIRRTRQVGLTAGRSLLRRVVVAAAARLKSDPRVRPIRDARQAWGRRRRLDESLARKTALSATKARRHEQRLRREQERAAQVEAVRREAEQGREKAFRDYERVRAWLIRDPGRAVAKEHTTAQEFLTPLWNADSAMIGALRRYCAPLGAVPPDAYDRLSHHFRLRLERELTVLQKQVGVDLCVPEPRVLGGFGVTRRHALYNEDTIEFFRTVAALKDGGVLSAFQTNTRRQVVWEVGGRWGGFAYQFKTLCPNVTYIITGPPEALLVSAVYLMSACPEARVHLCGEEEGSTPWAKYEQVDFIFMREEHLQRLTPPRLDLVLDVGVLQQVTSARMEAHVQRAFDLGAPYLYSMLREDAPVTQASVLAVLERWYWLNPMPARGLEVEGIPSQVSHVIGWRRIRA